MRRSSIWARFVVVCAVLLLPVVAHAQSAMSGVVRDASGAVLPGVTIEVSSPALIEQTKTVTSDGAGAYQVVDLRPGIYGLSFILPGFQTMVRDGIDLPSGFTATIDVTMRVGAMEEAITVTGAAPTVDVHSAGHVQTLDRQSIDSLPSGRTMQGMAQFIVGINLNAPDVGGSRSQQQTYMSAHGLGPAQNVVMVDGLPQNSIESNGQIQAYPSDAMIEQMVYQTSSISADRAGGGVSLNMIPREGGNRFSGVGTVSYKPGEWQGQNLTPRLAALGLQATSNTDNIFDVSFSEGGPIKRNKLWFFASVNQYRTSLRIANTFFDDGSQGVDKNDLKHLIGRVTWQASPRHKLTAYYDYTTKFRSNDMQSLVDPETASLRWTFPHYPMGQVKYTATLTNRLLLEAGVAFNTSYRNDDAQAGSSFERETAAWLAGASRTTQVAGPRAGAPAEERQEWKTKKVAQASLSYVTGSHNLKAGFGWEGGWFWHTRRANADLTQRYTSYTVDPDTRNFAFSGPVDVLVRNTPVESQERLNNNLSFYAQDGWKMKRLTLGYGLRWEYLNSQVDATATPAGRFVPARQQQDIHDVPSWKDLSPRFQAVYDLFGNSRTAIKYSLNRYNRAQTTGIAQTFNALTSTTAAVPWTDLNGDDVAQGARTWNANGTYTNCVYLTPGCELNLSLLSANFGLLGQPGAYSGLPRGWVLEHSLEVQHELLERLSVGFAWFGWNEHNLTKTVNTALQPADYSSSTLYNAIDGTPITYYNLSAAAAARATTNVTAVEPLRKSTYDGYFFEFRQRAAAGSQIFGGFGIERSLAVDCTTSIPGAAVDPNSLRFCDERENGKPFDKDFRLGASVAIPWGITLSGVYLNNDEGPLNLSYTFSRTTRYPDGSPAYKLAGGQIAPGCPLPCPAGQLVASSLTTSSATVALFAPGVRREERLKQVDVKAAKSFKVNAITIAPALEIFNLFNSDKVIDRVSTAYANTAGSYLQPNTILQGRIIGIAAAVRW